MPHLDLVELAASSASVARVSAQAFNPTIPMASCGDRQRFDVLAFRLTEGVAEQGCAHKHAIGFHDP